MANQLTSNSRALAVWSPPKHVVPKLPKTARRPSGLEPGRMQEWPLACSTPNPSQSSPPMSVDLPANATDGSTVGDLSHSSAHWVSKDVLCWRIPLESPKGAKRTFFLSASGSGGIQVTCGRTISVDWSCELVPMDQSLQYKALSKFPQLLGCTLFKVPQYALDNIRELVKYQLVVSCQDDGVYRDATGVQIPGMIDDLFYYEGPLGAQILEGGCVQVHLWAPTAFSVEVLSWESATTGDPEIIPLQQSSNGVWSLPHAQKWLWNFYKFRVTAYSPCTQRVHTVEVTDPYSRGLTANGERSQFVDLGDARLKPKEWDTHLPPTLDHFSDITVYELHIRDFSANDPSVPERARGKYQALSPLLMGSRTSNGMHHLQKLKAVGMTHIHLLPSYDFASVPERKIEQQEVDVDLSSFPACSEQQQQCISEIADKDAYNWGYDPVHYGVPEGSYASDPDGSARIIEFREMVKGLHDLGFRVVLDVVYNHTFECGPESKYSVLDKVVPGYYHRSEENGEVCGSACGANTASEHAMCERLIVDDVVHWATAYRVDGFRFDIMGHLMLPTMIKIQEAVSNLTLTRHGIDGKSIYLYGEAWDFGEVLNNQRGRNCCQLNIGGRGWGSFNDRIRDAVLGGSPLSNPSHQGFVSGLALDSNSNSLAQSTIAEQKKMLAALMDNIRIGIAGNLKQIELLSSDGVVQKGQDYRFHSQPTGYCLHPWENVPFVGCHDNSTLFDQMMMKAPDSADIRERAKMCQLAQSINALSQGVPFFHAGDEILRSKSFDVDSYNSGDWFNKIDWTYQSNNFGVGLPPAAKNRHQWAACRPLLANKSLVPDPSLIQESLEHFLLFVRIRYSSPLFRMRSADDICTQIKFPNSGPTQSLGLIVMELMSSRGPNEGTFDREHRRIVVAFNASPSVKAVDVNLNGLQLHPVLAEKSQSGGYGIQNDDKISVMGRSACVWVEQW